MNYEDLDHRIAQIEISKIIRSVIFSIQQIKAETLTTGHDSVLVNYWDEICVQIQRERFTNWTLYEYMIDLAIEAALEKYPRQKRVLISKVAEYEINGKIDSKDSEFPQIMVEYLNQKVLEAAENYTNIRIRKYLDRVLLF